jgi:hypothetical protein
MCVAACYYVLKHFLCALLKSRRIHSKSKLGKIMLGSQKDVNNFIGIYLENVSYRIFDIMFHLYVKYVTTLLAVEVIYLQMM